VAFSPRTITPLPRYILHIQLSPTLAWPPQHHTWLCTLPYHTTYIFGSCLLRLCTAAHQPTYAVREEATALRLPIATLPSACTRILRYYLVTYTYFYSIPAGTSPALPAAFHLQQHLPTLHHLLPIFASTATAFYTCPLPLPATCYTHCPLLLPPLRLGGMEEWIGRRWEVGVGWWSWSVGGGESTSKISA